MIELISIVVRNERRLRLVFSAPLAFGAFGTPAPAYYVIDNEDGAAPSPGVNAAILVIGAVTNVELALDTDLATGALYRVRAIGVPAQDASTSTSASDQRFRPGTPQQQTNVEPKVNDQDLLLFGRDLVFQGDYVETAEGDLEVISGLPNAQAALKRRMLGAPHPWAPDYSPRARQYVDAPFSLLGSLRSRLEAQALRDDRVKSVVATLVLGENDEDAYFDVKPKFIGSTPAQSFDVPISAP